MRLPGRRPPRAVDFENCSLAGPIDFWQPLPGLWRGGCETLNPRPRERERERERDREKERETESRKEGGREGWGRCPSVSADGKENHAVGSDSAAAFGFRVLGLGSRV